MKRLPAAFAGIALLLATSVANAVLPSDSFIEKNLASSWKYIEDRDFPANVHRGAVKLAPQPVVREIYMPDVPNQPVLQWGEEFQSARAKQLRGDRAYVGEFECDKTASKYSYDTKTNAKNKKLTDITFHCVEKEKLGLVDKQLVMVVDSKSFKEKDQSTLKLTACLMSFKAFEGNANFGPARGKAGAKTSVQVAPTAMGYFRIKYKMNAYTCEAAPDRRTFFVSKSTAFIDVPRRPFEMDKEARVSLFAVNMIHADTTAEFKHPYEEGYEKTVYDTLLHPTEEKYSRNLAFFLSRSPRTIPGMEMALQVSTSASSPAWDTDPESAADACVGWDEAPGLISTSYHAGHAKKWAHAELMMPSYRQKEKELFYPVLEKEFNYDAYANVDFKHANKPPVFYDGEPFPDLPGWKGKYFFLGGVQLPIPVPGQPDFATTLKLRCDWKAKNQPVGALCPLAKPWQGKSCGKEGATLPFGENCLCQCQTFNSDVELYARVVPIIREMGKPRCVIHPSNWVKVKMTPYNIIDNSTIAGIASLNQAMKKNEQELMQDQLGDNKGPFEVKVLSYVPNNALSGTLTYATTNTELLYATKGLKYRGPGDKTPYHEALKIAAHYDEDKDIPLYEGCAFSSSEMEYAAKHYDLWKKIQLSEDFWEWSEGVIDAVSGIYNGLLVDIWTMGAAAALEEAGVKCESMCRSAIGTGISMAWAYVGVPSRIPNSEQLYDEGAMYAASVAARYATNMGVEVYPELANVPFLETAIYTATYELTEKKLKAANPYRNHGYLDCDKNNDCTRAYHTMIPYTWGTDDPRRSDKPPTIFLKVIPKDIPGYLNLVSGKTAGVYKTPEVINISIKSKSGIWKDQEVPVDLKTFPGTVDPNGSTVTYREFVIPVVLHPNIDMSIPEADCGGKDMLCKSYNKAQQHWMNKKFQNGEASNDIEISSSFRWTLKDTYYVSPMMKVDWQTLDGKVTEVQSFPFTPQWPGQPYYGLAPKATPCMGFYWKGERIFLKGNYQ